MNICIEKTNFDVQFPVDEALSRGTLFKELYKPYKKNEYNIGYANDKKERSLQIIQQLCFVKTEINLYLDCYPDDKEALEMLEIINAELDKMLDYFSKNYYGLSNDKVLKDGFSYATSPFPWEGNK